MDRLRIAGFFVVLFLTVSLLGVVDANAWNPDGTWVNLDQNSGDTQSIVINYPSIRGYGQCTPTPCDWGDALYTSKLAATHDSSNDDRAEYTAIWIFGFKWTFMYISPHPENPDYIIVKTYDLYDLAGDSRTNRYTIEYLKKQ